MAIETAAMDDPDPIVDIIPIISEGIISSMEGYSQNTFLPVHRIQSSGILNLAFQFRRGNKEKEQKTPSIMEDEKGQDEEKSGDDSANDELWVLSDIRCFDEEPGSADENEMWKTIAVQLPADENESGKSEAEYENIYAKVCFEYIYCIHSTSF